MIETIADPWIDSGLVRCGAEKPKRSKPMFDFLGSFIDELLAFIGRLF